MTDNITLPRKHIDYAAHALEHFNKDAPDPLVSEIIHHLCTALAAEQPKPEPVAWQCREHGDDEWFDCSKEAYGINPSRYVYRCLYTAPPDAEALRRDAERYRWMTENHPEHETRSRVYSVTLLFNAYQKEHIDAAIDAAMEEKR